MDMRAAKRNIDKMSVTKKDMDDKYNTENRDINLPVINLVKHQKNIDTNNTITITIELNPLYQDQRGFEEAKLAMLSALSSHIKNVSNTHYGNVKTKTNIYTNS